MSKKIADSFSKLDQALKDLVESYASLVTELENKHGEEDEEALSAAIIEAIETSIEGAIDEQGCVALPLEVIALAMKNLLLITLRQ